MGNGGVTCQDGHITYMDLEQTSISGTIPDSISALTKLTVLDLDQRFCGTCPSISGTIPDSISALTALGGLYLDSTRISGSIPDSISALTKLTVLYLAVAVRPTPARCRAALTS